MLMAVGLGATLHDRFRHGREAGKQHQKVSNAWIELGRCNNTGHVNIDSLSEGTQLAVAAHTIIVLLHSAQNKQHSRKISTQHGVAWESGRSPTPSEGEKSEIPPTQPA